MITVRDGMVVGSAVVGFLIITVLGKRWGWYELVGGTNKLLKEQNQELRNQNAFLKEEVGQMTAKNEQDRNDAQAKHEENLKQLNQMQGQIDVLQKIPLVNIDATLKKIADANSSLAISNNQIKDTNKKILDRLEATADIAEEDRDVLTDGENPVSSKNGKKP